MMTTKVTPKLTIESVMTASMHDYDKNDDEDVEKNDEDEMTQLI